MSATSAMYPNRIPAIAAASLGRSGRFTALPHSVRLSLMLRRLAIDDSVAMSLVGQRLSVEEEASALIHEARRNADACRLP